MAERDYANDTTPELIKCLQVAAAVCQVYAHVVDAEMLLAAAQRLAETEAARVQAEGHAQAWYQKWCDAGDESGKALDEIDRLRAWKEEASKVIDMWERCYDAVEAKGSHARPGDFKSDHVLKWIESE